MNFELLSKEIKRTAKITEEIVHQYRELREKKLNFSSESKEELLHLFDIISEINDLATRALKDRESDAIKAYALEEEIVNEAELLVEKYVEKLKKGTEKPASGVKWGEIIQELVRVSYHQRKVSSIIKKIDLNN